MQITSNVSNRYAGIQRLPALQKSIAEEFEVKGKEQEETEERGEIKTEILKGYSYIPEIIDDSEKTEEIERISIKEGVSNEIENERGRAYIDKVYRQRTEVDYSGMSGAEIIQAVIDRYNKYFDCEDFLEAGRICSVRRCYEPEKYYVADKLTGRMFREIGQHFKRYNINGTQAYSDYYGYSGMTAEEKRNSIVSEYCGDGVVTYEKYIRMILKMYTTGAISSDEFFAANKVGAAEMYKPDRVMDIKELLNKKYNTIKNDYSDSEMTEEEIKILKDNAKACIMVFESIIDVLERNKSDE